MSVPDLQADVQRLVLAGVGRLANRATYVLAEVVDARAAQAVLRRERDHDDSAQRHDWSDVRALEGGSGGRPVSVAFAFTASGLAQLGVETPDLATFPVEFRQGPHLRSAPLGDIAANGPATWLTPFKKDEPLHVVLVVSEEVGGTHGSSLRARLSDATSGLRVLGSLDGELPPDRTEPFGFVDGPRQPWIREAHPVGAEPPRGVDAVPLGEFVLGHSTQFGDRVRRWRVPGRGEETERLGYNGSFAALRVMRQNLEEFAAWKRANGGIAAAEKACGIRSNGDDLPDGIPIESHVGRANPRQRPLVSRGHHHRRLLRRGIPGTWHDSGRQEVGLLGLFICASLAAQYEGVLGEWLHHGIHDPKITGTNDPLVGYQGPRKPSFVTTRGVAYLFLPGRAGLRRILGG